MSGPDIRPDMMPGAPLALTVCLASIPDLCVLPICLTSMSYQYPLLVYLTNVLYQYALPLFLTSIPYQYALPVYPTSIVYSMSYQYSLPVCLTISYQYALPVSAIPAVYLIHSKNITFLFFTFRFFSVVKLLVATAIFCSYFIQAYVPIKLVEPWIFEQIPENMHFLTDIFIRMLLVLFTCK